ncbi:hypothetical protein [Aeromonas dhakensis]|uniref:hypothetical protein n=1 Tax=Aeromonas dhakensis TaxID=196024 RepID=UPI001AF269F7|nr:hypothetical protein [Aeromonas dhakensis]QSR54453.1 hypothetical protein GO601_02800 [Aeromonas dhakensis]
MMNHRTMILGLLAGSLLFSPLLPAADIVTYVSPESDRDLRSLYGQQLLQLALEKTRDSFGDYELRPAPSMSRTRLRQVLQYNLYPNLLAIDSFPRPEGSHDLDYVRFPVDLGILGYRICFVSPKQQQAVARVRTLSDLQQFIHGQGRGWQDADILRAAGFKVQEVEGYERLFKLVVRGRVDLFCRGANELLSELDTHKDLGPLMVDQHLALYYPFVHLFYSHKENQRALRRIRAGLQLAWQDGSLQALWLKTYQPALAFARLDQRQLFRLDNPLLQGLDFDYHPYLYDPLTQRFGPGEPATSKP